MSIVNAPCASTNTGIASMLRIRNWSIFTPLKLNVDASKLKSTKLVLQFLQALDKDTSPVMAGWAVTPNKERLTADGMTVATAAAGELAEENAG